MKARIGGIWIAGCVVMLAGLAAPAYEASRGPTELIHWDPRKAYPGYAFIRTRPSGVTGVYLIDMAGQVVNYWPEFTDAYLLEDGTMFGAKGPSTFSQVDWKGNVLWEHTESRETHHPHHDFLRIYNPELEEYSGHKQMGGTHDIQWIKDGLPGAGDLLLFNNGLTVPRADGDQDPQSEILQINPYLDADGVEQDRYVNPPEAGYADVMPGSEESQNLVTRLFSKQIAWMYHTSDGFNSHHGSATQRLPNGNTMAQLARVGRLLEITPGGEVVWEYVNPVTNAGIVKTLITSEHENVFGGWSPLRYPVDFPGLAGKDLSPKGSITDFHGDGTTGGGSASALAGEEEDY